MVTVEDDHGASVTVDDDVAKELGITKGVPVSSDLVSIARTMQLKSKKKVDHKLNTPSEKKETVLLTDEGALL